MKKQKPKQSKKKNSVRRKSPVAVFVLAAVLSLCLFVGYMFLQAHIVHLRFAEITLADLPQAFDGTKILYLSDLKLSSAQNLKSTRRMMKRLAQLQPDILLLGGDYSGRTLYQALNGSDGEENRALSLEWLKDLSDFPAPMGRFAVLGERDGRMQNLSDSFQQAQIVALSDNYFKITKDDQSLVLVGLQDRSMGNTDLSKLGAEFSANDCVLVLAHNPASYVDVRVSEAKDGGAWADLVLSGHTLGGQINFFGRSLRAFSEEERRSFAGWYYANDLPLLVSEGVGTEDVPLRFASKSQVHLITLRRGRSN